MNLIKVGKLSSKFIVLFLFIIVGLFLVLPQKTHAYTGEVVVNEIMANPQGADTGKEWFELLCLSDTNLLGWKINFYNDPTSQIPTRTMTLVSQEIKTGDYVVIPNNTTTAVTNAKGKIIFSNPDGSYKQEISWTKDVGDGYSMEIIGPTFDPDYQQWLKSSDLDGSPGVENSVFGMDIPSVPEYISPENNKQFFLSSEINFSWVEKEGINYEYQIAQDESFTNLIDSSALEIGQYFWRVKAENQLGKVYTIPRSFEIIEPFYSNAITINEIMPNPVGDDTAGEWIELYNSSAERVNLKGWIFQDSGLTQHIIQNDLYIESRSYLLVYRNISGLTLNNDGDEVKLYQPNNVLLSNASYINDGEEGWTWARGPTGEWSWTTTPTMADVNIISLPKINNDMVLETEPVINTIPIEIPTGDYQNYLDKLVKIRGKIISTSGNTFYLDDDSGVIKVYIQEKTGIKNPEMHRNDIFEIIGVIDLYGQTWRILPRTLNDIVLIEKAPVVTKTTTTKKVVSKEVTAVKSPLISKAVAAASTPPATENKDKNNTLNQLIKTSIGLAILFLVFLIIKILNQPKIKTSRQLGGHFGDDET